MSDKASPKHSTIAPAELRSMFGANLRLLSRPFASIAGLCRELEINRTQFNRYLTGESFPRPDVLHRICNFFGVDARILLEPVEEIRPVNDGFLSHPAVADCLGRAASDIPEDFFPSGFYRFSRRSFTDDTQFILGLVYVFRKDGYTFIRGYEAKEAMKQQGLPADARTREFRGYLMMQEEGIAAVVSRREANTGSFNFLSRVASFQNNFWEGYVTRTTRESLSSRRATRMIYEHLDNECGAVLSAARSVGFCSEDQLIPYHRRLLRLDQPFR